MAKKVQKIKCRGTNRNGQPCQSWAMHGGMVCGKHGGKAPQVLKKAAERKAEAEFNVMQALEAMLPKATQTLIDIMEDPTARAQDRQRAAEAIVDRFAPKQAAVKVDVTNEERDLDAELDKLLDEQQQPPEAEAG